MFKKFYNKIRLVVTFTIMVVVFIYMVTIFILFSSYLKKDYMNKVNHINTTYAKCVEAHLLNVEESALLFADVRDLTAENVNFSSAVFRNFRKFLSSNTDISNLIFYTEHEIYFYNTKNRSMYEEYISKMRSLPPEEQLKNHWSVLSEQDSGKDLLIYAYSLVDGDTLVGHLLLEVDPSSFYESAKVLDNTFMDNTSSCLYLEDGTAYFLLPSEPEEGGADEDRTPFGLSSLKASNSFTSSINLDDLGIRIETVTFLQSIFQKCLIMGGVFLLIFLVTMVCIIYIISLYGRHIARQLEQLVEKIDTFSKTERDTL